MPFESLLCPRCGSGDAQEVKPGTYFCNHCDNVFKYVSPRRTGSSGGCEVLVEERSCGVPALGRCRSCQRAFCLTHQARVGVERLVSEDRYRPGSAYSDWCTACRTAEFYAAVNDNETALTQPFGTFVEERFLAWESRDGFGVSVPEEKIANDLSIEADYALAEYGHEPGDPKSAPIGEDLQLADGNVVDRTAFASGTSERLTSIRRPDGRCFYRHDSLWSGQRSKGSYSSVWVAGGSKMLVAKYSEFGPVSPLGSGGYLPPVIRYSDVEEVGLSRMEGITASIKRSFPRRPSPEEGAPARKERRRWIR